MKRVRRRCGTQVRQAARALVAAVIALMSESDAWSQQTRAGIEIREYLRRSAGGAIGVLDGLTESGVCIWRSPTDPKRVEICIGDVTQVGRHRIVMSRRSGDHWLPMIPPVGAKGFHALSVGANDGELLNALRDVATQLRGGAASGHDVTLMEGSDPTEPPAIIWRMQPGPFTLMCLGSAKRHEGLLLVDRSFRAVDECIILPSGCLARIRDRETVDWTCIAVGQEGLLFANGTNAVVEWIDQTASPATFLTSPVFSLDDIVAQVPGWVLSVSTGASPPAGVDAKRHFAALSVSSPRMWSDPTVGGYAVDPEIWVFPP